MFQRPASRQRGLALAAITAAIAACAGPGLRPPAPAPTAPPAAPAEAPAEAQAPARLAPHQAAAVAAVRQVGVPYRYGGSDSDGFDCSGLVWYAWRHAGRQLPRTTATLWRRLAPVAKGKLQVGDVLFFRIDGTVSHVGLYLGDSRFVHAPASGREVTIESLDAPFYRQAFVRAGRP